MSSLQKVLAGAGVVIGVGVIAFVALLFFVGSKKSKYDRIALPYFAEVMPVLSTWDPERFEVFWAPEVVEDTDPQRMRRFFKFFESLGPLVSYSTPEFQQISASTEVPYPLVRYLIRARYEGGPATLTFDLVPVDDGLRVWFCNIDSDVFLPTVEENPEDEPS